MTFAATDFEAAGFVRRETESVAETWIKHFQVVDSPYLHAHVEDEHILGTMVAKVTIVAHQGGWFIQLAIEAASYEEEALSLEGEEGEAVFRDAACARAQSTPARPPFRQRPC